MSERTYPLLYIFQLSTIIRNEYRTNTFLGRVINSWSWSWVAHLWHQLGIFHHASNLDVVTLSSNDSKNWYSLLWMGLHIKALWCCQKGYHWFEIHSTEHKVVSLSKAWTQYRLLTSRILDSFITSHLKRSDVVAPTLNKVM